MPSAEGATGCEGPGSWLHTAQVMSRLAFFLPSWLEMGPLTLPNSLMSHPPLGPPGQDWGCSSVCSFSPRPGEGVAEERVLLCPLPRVCGPWPEFTGTDAQSPPASCFCFCLWPRAAEWGEGWYPTPLWGGEWDWPR